MKKMLVFLMIGLLLIGVASVALADDDDIEDDVEKEEIEDEAEEKAQERNEKIAKKQLKIEKKTRITTEENGKQRKIEIKREVEYDDDGRKTIKIKRKYVNADGTRIETQIKIETRTEDGKNKTFFKYKRESGEEDEVKTELEIEDEFEGNESRIKIKMKNGTRIRLKVLPDQVSETIFETLKTRNFTIELKEVKHKNIPRVVYNIQAGKPGRFLGIFKLKLKVETQIDPETGEVIVISKPWWAFLVTEPTEPEVPGNETNGTGPENTTEPGNTPEPGNSTEPGNTTEPGNQTEPGNTTNSTQ
jgi:hypothetical protein